MCEVHNCENSADSGIGSTFCRTHHCRFGKMASVGKDAARITLDRCAKYIIVRTLQIVVVLAVLFAEHTTAGSAKMPSVGKDAARITLDRCAKYIIVRTLQIVVLAVLFAEHTTAGSEKWHLWERMLLESPWTDVRST